MAVVSIIDGLLRFGHVQGVGAPKRKRMAA